MSSEPRLVVVGYGMGAHHARLIKEVPGLRLHGVCDVAPDKRERAAAEHPGIRVYSAMPSVLADTEVDVVVIVTPHNTHAPLAIKAMEAGKHVVTDKAICVSSADLEQMIAARDRSGVHLTTFHNRRWDGDFLTVRRVVESGQLGMLYHIDSNVTYHAHMGGWRSDRDAMGGWMFDWGAHTLDQILLLASARPKYVHAISHYRRRAISSVEDHIRCDITFDTGLTASTTIGFLSRIPMQRWYIIGEEATLVGPDFDQPLRVKTEWASLGSDITIPLLKTEWRAFYQNLEAALAGREPLAVTPEQLVPQIAIAEAAYRSIETHQVIRLG